METFGRESRGVMGYMLKHEDWKNINELICLSTSGLSKTDDILIEIYKFMQMQINKLEKDNRSIKRELNRLKKQVRKSRLGG